MKVVESEEQVDKYGRQYIKFTGVKTLQEIYDWLWLHYQGSAFGMTINLTYDEPDDVGKER